MRGKTIKNIKKFVDILIKNTAEADRVKSRDEMINEVKTFWQSDPSAKRFVQRVIQGEDLSYTLEKKK